MAMSGSSRQAPSTSLTQQDGHATGRSNAPADVVERYDFENV